MSVHYKFKNTIQYDNIKFDGVYISANDLKSIIVQQKKLGASEIQLENEETGQTYVDDQMIPKNTHIIVTRTPLSNSNKRTRLMNNQPYPSRYNNNNNNNNSESNSNSNNRHHNNINNNNNNNNNKLPLAAYDASSASTSSSLNNNREAMELVSNKQMSEEEKLKSIQSQSTKDFDIRRPHPRGGRGGYRPHYTPGPGYVCKKCNIPGHFIHDCKSSMNKVKRASGIPRTSLMIVDSKEKGALMTPSGEYAVPFIDREAYNNPKVEKAPFFEDEKPIS